VTRAFRAQWELRAAFARRMAVTYGREVPTYLTLVDVAAAVNAEVVARNGDAAQRLGSIERVTAERHGAIRVGTPNELRAVARIFGALGMHPVGWYDLRETARSAVPVVSTAFRPVAAGELARNPFRMFTSMLVTDDRRFFSADLQSRLDAFLARRTLFPPELLKLADRSVAAGGLGAEDAARFLDLATASFALSGAPIDRAWYAELETVSAVAADIGGVASTHINHLTPRVLDIDALYRQMKSRGIAMIDAIQGPPSWHGPDVLLRQTSFRALDERRPFREADGSVVPGSLRVRFGEVEARGIALTPAGRDRYDAMLAEVDARLAARGDNDSSAGVSAAVARQEVAAEVWADRLPATELGLLRDGLAYFTVELTTAADRVRAATPFVPPPQRTRSGELSASDRQRIAGLVGAGVLTATPIVYEDFLPRSAAGIFQSNLTGDGSKDMSLAGTDRDADWLAGLLAAEVADPYALYAAQQQAALTALGRELIGACNGEIRAVPRPTGEQNLPELRLPRHGRAHATTSVNSPIASR
jgi:uncharacterized glyoxalase superfamily metalloenzyme YdcJ